MPPRLPVVIGYHLIVTGYGHWPPNDPRGSGSSRVASGELRRLGPIHFGQMKAQPSRRDNYKVFKDSVEKMWNAVHCIRRNPERDRLAPQTWDFVTPYDGWPHARH